MHGNRAIAVWPALLLVGLWTLPGCTVRPPVVDLYVDAVALRELGQEQLAIEKLNAVVAADPDFALAYAELGKAYAAAGHQEKALAAFERAARLDTWSFENHLNLAQTCEKLEKYSAAAVAYGRAAELDPKSAAALLGAARCHLQAGEYLQSLKYCELAEQADKAGDILPLLARVYEGQKDYERAVEVYQRLLASKGNDPNVLLPLGVAYIRAQRYDEARQSLLTVTQLRPHDGVAFRHLGYCAIKLGHIDEAVQMYQRAIDTDAQDWEAERGMGVACMLKAGSAADSRWRAQALEHWRCSLALKPDQPKHQILEKLIRENTHRSDPLQGLSD
jgi:tetratricopeptide (TPR) repeat protein